MKRRLTVALWIVLGFLWSFPVWALDYTDLYEYLPDLPGFKAQPPSGMKVQTAGGVMVSAEREYRGSGPSLKVQIITGPMVAGMWLPFSMQFSYENPQEKLETTSIEGFPAKVLIRKPANSGEILVLLSSSNTPDALFVMHFQGLSPEEARKYIPSFRLKELASRLRP